MVALRIECWTPGCVIEQDSSFFSDMTKKLSTGM